jgi:hypothetical protein
MDPSPSKPKNTSIAKVCRRSRVLHRNNMNFSKIMNPILDNVTVITTTTRLCRVCQHRGKSKNAVEGGDYCGQHALIEEDSVLVEAYFQQLYHQVKAGSNPQHTANWIFQQILNQFMVGNLVPSKHLKESMKKTKAKPKKRGGQSFVVIESEDDDEPTKDMESMRLD